MAYDEQLADRVRGVLPDPALVSEQQMFGGLAFMLGGHMFCGVVKDQLMLRLGPEGARRALTRPHVRPMDFTGRPMASMVFVDRHGLKGTALLGGDHRLRPAPVTSRVSPGQTAGRSRRAG